MVYLSHDVVSVYKYQLHTTNFLVAKITSAMKAISVAACLFLTTVLAAERDITPDCYSNCVAFANRLKGKTNVNLKQEAREFCDDSNIKVCFTLQQRSSFA